MSSQSSAMKKNNLLDKFYTNVEVAERLMEQVDNHINFNNDEWFVEPSAGNGIWIDSYKSLYEDMVIENNIIGYDLKPDRADIIEQDFLTLNLQRQFQDTNIHFIGNPPFGRSSKLCRAFIKSMCNYPNTQSISLILPISYCKPFNQDTSFSKNFHLVYEEILEKNAFTNEVCNKKKFNVNAVFQIWIRKDTERISRKHFGENTIQYKGFNYKKHTEADFAVCYKGNSAGKIAKLTDTNGAGLIIQSPSYHFIQLEDKVKKIISVKDFMNVYKVIAFKNFVFYDVGSRSVNRKEYNNELTKCVFFSMIMSKYLKLNSILEKFDRLIEISKFIVNC